MASAVFGTPGQNIWTAPAGVSTVQVELWGAGGGGGGNNTTSDGGGGGGSGGYARLDAYTVSPGNLYTYNVGTAAPGSSGTTNASAGGPTWWISAATFQAPGGLGGFAAFGAGSPRVGGAGGTSFTGSFTVTRNGLSGGTGINGNAGTGGGGGGSPGDTTTGTAGAVGAGTGGAGGSAGTTNGAIGGAGGNVGAAGSPGNQPGSGGGGAGDGGTLSGGTGGVGQVRLVWATSTTYSDSAGFVGGHVHASTAGLAFIDPQAYVGGHVHAVEETVDSAPLVSEITYAVYPDPDPIPGDIGVLTDEPVGTSYEDTIALVAGHGLAHSNTLASVDTQAYVAGHVLAKSSALQSLNAQAYVAGHAYESGAGPSFSDEMAFVAGHVLEKTNEPFSAMETVSLAGGHQLENTITAEQNVEQIYELKADLVLADADVEPPVVEEPTTKRRVYPAQLVIIPGRVGIEDEDEVVEALEPPPKPKEIRLSRSQRKKLALAQSRIPVDVQAEIKAKADAFVEKQAKVEQKLERLIDKILLAEIIAKQEEEEEEDLAIWLLL